MKRIQRNSQPNEAITSSEKTRRSIRSNVSISNDSEKAISTPNKSVKRSGKSIQEEEKEISKKESVKTSSPTVKQKSKNKNDTESEIKMLEETDSLAQKLKRSSKQTSKNKNDSEIIETKNEKKSKTNKSAKEMSKETSSPVQKPRRSSKQISKSKKDTVFVEDKDDKSSKTDESEKEIGRETGLVAQKSRKSSKQINKSKNEIDIIEDKDDKISKPDKSTLIELTSTTSSRKKKSKESLGKDDVEVEALNISSTMICQDESCKGKQNTSKELKGDCVKSVDNAKKRKRGQSKGDSLPTDDTIEEIPKKRKRSDQSLDISSNVCDNSMIIDKSNNETNFLNKIKSEPHISRGRPKKSSNDGDKKTIIEGTSDDIIVLKETQSEMKTEKRGPGRPKKSLDKSVTELKTMGDKTTPRSRKNKRKLTVESDVSFETDSSPERMNISSSRTKSKKSSKEDGTSSSEAVKKSVRRRSKVKKHVDFESDESGDNSATDESEEYDDEEKKEKVVQTRPKRKGKPPKIIKHSIMKSLNIKDTELVTCQVCKTEMDYKTYCTRHKAFHNLLCWTQYDDPIDLFDASLVLSILHLKRKRKDLKFVCPLCGLLKKSELGYYSHILLCEKSEEEIEKAYRECAVCAKKIFLPHYQAHEREHKRYELNSLGVGDADKDLAADDDAKPDTSLLQDGGEESSKRSAAKKAKSKIALIVEDLVTIDGERPKLKRKPKEDEEFEVSGDEEGCEEEEEDDDEEEAEEGDLEKSNEEQSVHSESEHSDSEDSGKDQRFQRKSVLSSLCAPLSRISYGYEHTSSLFSKHALFVNFKCPSDWKILDKVSAEEYLPIQKESMSFEFPNQEAMRLRLFASHSMKKNLVLFCGGPIWSLAWLPQLFSEKRRDEYLAVSVQQDMDQLHGTNETQAYKSMIQIWQFPQMSCLETPRGPLASPRLVLGIAHEDGVVCSLEWCPSGGYIENERLGLLAAACTSGRILFYSVPIIHSSESETPIIALLEPVRVFQLDDFNSTPCYCLAWKTTTPHSQIIAGYGDGTVAVFDIEPKLDLFIQDRIVFPINIFQAHVGNISVLSLNAIENGRFLLTVGGDKYTKLWDLTDVSSPVHSCGQSTGTHRKPISGGFVPFLPLQLTGMDMTRFSETATFMSSSIREFGFTDSNPLKPLLIQNSAHFAVSFSHLVCAVVTGNEDGTLYLNARGSSCCYLGSRTKKFNHHILLNTKLTPNSNNEDFGDSSYETTSVKYKLQYIFQLSETKKVLNEEFDLANFMSSAWNNNVSSFEFVAAGQKCGLLHIFDTNLHSQSLLDNFIKGIQKGNAPYASK